MAGFASLSDWLFRVAGYQPPAVDVTQLQPNGTVADQRLTIDNTAGGVQFAAFGADATHCLVTFETAQCRMTVDGSAPTTTNGHVIEAGEVWLMRKELAVAAKFIRTGAASAVAHSSELKF